MNPTWRYLASQMFFSFGHAGHPNSVRLASRNNCRASPWMSLHQSHGCQQQSAILHCYKVQVGYCTNQPIKLTACLHIFNSIQPSTIELLRPRMVEKTSETNPLQCGEDMFASCSSYLHPAHFMGLRHVCPTAIWGCPNFGSPKSYGLENNFPYGNRYTLGIPIIFRHTHTNRLHLKKTDP